MESNKEVESLSEVKQSRMSEQDLNERCCHAATAYINSPTISGCPLDEKHLMMNACAHGFYMGVRWMEQNND